MKFTARDYKRDHKEMEAVEEPKALPEYEPTVHVSLPSDAVDGLEKGQRVKLVLVGDVSGFSSYDYGSNVELKVSSGELTVSNEFSEMADEDA